ncbi:hypothetical protein DAEQUDRAFT_200452 [Daedalea quercina L-15889]|uniref:Uncharacterized protein n=1 Tax=Daedalea quercina L-15889 TaxID=1314783 RepID=A0A165U9H2_9APHY|nr:hypothetical protein DAEQUDRAFT_200452 [Daedalea quercina L-15889]
MNHIMEQAREDRLAVEYMDMLRGRWDPLKVTLRTLMERPEARTYRLGAGDIALMPEVRDIMCVPEDIQR